MTGRETPAELRIEPEKVAALIERFVIRIAAQSGLARAVLGLSGGVDSAVVAALCTRALGAANVHVFMLPYRASSAESLRDAEAVVDTLGLHAETIDISPLADAYFAGRELDRIRQGNVLARLRMTVLFDMAREHDALVAGTGNKTETYLGYSTWYGDSAASFQAIADLYKTQVWALATWLGLPRVVIDKVPSADLWPGQTDEDELGVSYLEADRILHALLDSGLRPSELKEKGFDPEQVRKVVRIIRATQFKRQMPAVAKLSTRTAGLDFLLSSDFDPDSEQ